MQIDPEVPRSTQKYPVVPGSTQKYLEVPEGTRKYPEVPGSTRKYQEVPVSTRKYPEVPRSTQKYLEVPESTHIYLDRIYVLQETKKNLDGLRDMDENEPPLANKIFLYTSVYKVVGHPTYIYETEIKSYWYVQSAWMLHGCMVLGASINYVDKQMGRGVS